MFKFLHAADIHLDSPLTRLERYDGAPVDRIRQATRRALENLVQLALDEKVQFVLIAGDLYDGSWRDYNTGLFLTAQMARLREANTPVILVAGNHDAANKMTRTLRLPDNVTLLPTANPGSKQLEDIGVVVHGQSFAKPAEQRDLSAKYPQATTGLFNIGLLHTCATGAEGHESYAPCTIDGLLSKGYSYWALGHVHQRKRLHPDPAIVFPGNTQGRSIVETGAKGCMLVTVSGDGSVGVDFQTLDVFRWERCEVNARGAESGGVVMERLSKDLQEKIDVSEGLPLAIRVEIRGACPAHHDLHANPRKWTNEVRATANEIGAEQIWIEKVKLQTAPLSINDANADDGPIAELLALLNQLQADEGELAKLHEEIVDLEKKLPGEIKEGPDSLSMSDTSWLRSMLGHVGPLLVDRLRSREEKP
jgi:DNA repair exonuclease SbcCD nuclease subunit